MFHPDEAVTGAIHIVFARFAELGSVRQVWLWLRSQGFYFPLQWRRKIRWVTPTYTAIHGILPNPVYAGAYTCGTLTHLRNDGHEGLTLG